MTNSLLVTEIFESIQGEGVRVGVPSLFIRSFGCNLSCPGFGQEPDNMIPIEEMPHNKFDVSKISSIEELPVFPIGCDSSAAWSKRYRHLSKKITVKVILDQLDMSLVQDIVITGGEPLLKKAQGFWAELLTTLVRGWVEYVTFETNGTQVLTDELAWAIKRRNQPIIFSVSPKLSCSGEPIEKTLVPEAVRSYVETIEGNPLSKCILKFVVDPNRIDQYMSEIRHFVEEYSKVTEEFNWMPGENVYLMPVGGTLEELQKNERAIADTVIEYGFKYSPRLHINLYGNTWGT